MELEPEQTPDSYISIRCMKEFSRGVKVMENISEAGEIFYHVAREPPLDQIQSPDDIETIKGFSVGDGETVSEVRGQAFKAAEMEAQT